MPADSPTAPTEAEVAPPDDGDEDLDSGADVLDELTGEEEVTDDDGESPPETEEQEDEQPRDPDGWVAIVSENPARISEVPRKFHSQVVSAALAEAKRQAEAAVEEDFLKRLPTLQQEAYKAGLQRAEFDFTMRAIDAKAEEDPAYLGQLRKTNPGAFQAYSQWSAAQTRASAQPSMDSSGVTTEEWADLNKRLEASPEAVELLAKSGPHKRDLRFYRAALRALEDVQGNAEAKKKATRREAAAQARKKLPKPETTNGTAAGPITAERLKNMSVREVTELLKTNPEIVNKALASPNSRSGAP